jgi:hypothetical protein
MWYIFTHRDAQAEPPSESARVAQESSRTMATTTIAGEPPLKRRRRKAQQETRNVAPQMTGPEFRHARDKAFYDGLPGSSENLGNSRQASSSTNAPLSDEEGRTNSTHVTRLAAERRSALLAGLRRVYFGQNEDVSTEELQRAATDVQRRAAQQTPHLIVIEDGESDESPPPDTTNIAGKSPV